jgi:tRNA (mo5U34)-methyltransferase
MTALDAELDGAALRARVASIEWYHSLELAENLTTPGWLDHRPIVGRVPLPRSLDGRRCLDVGTFNGFWAFEMERRGAAEVVAIDVLDPHRWDWPVDSDAATVAALARRMAGGEGFEIARAALGSRVRRVDCSVYELDAAELGRFDFVYLGSLLVHLRDPVRALEKVRPLCDGTLVVVDGIDLPLSLRAPRLPVARIDARGRPWWWYPNLAALARLVEAGGFTVSESPRRLFVPPGSGWAPRRFQLGHVRSRYGREQLTAAWLGEPHGVIVARPSPASGVRARPRAVLG